jgi:alcohol dehydrogenase
MRAITLLQPPRLVFGNGCAESCAEFLKQQNCRRILLVSSSQVLPHLAGLIAQIQSTGGSVIPSQPTDVEPTITLFEQVLQRARKEQIDSVLGIGGGSALDVAKLVAALAQSKQNIREVFGIGRLSSRRLLLVCLPTTAGTGSEVSPNAILLDESDQLKKGVVSPHLVPDAALVDPLLTLSVPPGVTAATGLDALTHCIEAFANRFAHPMVDLYALEGIRLISGNLPRAVRNGRDLEARAALALGSLYGGLCLGPVNTAAVHALAYPLGGQFHIAHGVSNAVLLPHVLHFNLSAAPERYAEVARALGAGKSEDQTAEWSHSGAWQKRNVSEAIAIPQERRCSTPLIDDSPLEIAERGLALLEELSVGCGIPKTLRELGIPRDALPGLAKAAMQVTRLLKNNLRTVTEADALQIYQRCYGEP